MVNYRTSSTDQHFNIFENVERERLDNILDVITPFSEMQKNEKYFLNGIIRYLKPKKILEVGVSSGGGSAIILNAISDISEARLFSVDYSEICYTHKDKLSGFLVEEQFPHLKDKWRIFRGGDVSRFIEDIGNDIDLMMLDTAHIHPWETLNFLCVLPFLKKNNSWVVLHDISLPYLYGRENDRACRYLWGHVVSEEKIKPTPDDIPVANIGSFRVTDDTEKYVGNLFESLFIPWEASFLTFKSSLFPCAIPLLEKDIVDVQNIIQRYYPSQYFQLFIKAVEFQKNISQHKLEQEREFEEKIEQRIHEEIEQQKFKNRCKSFLRRACPRSYNFLKKTKSLFIS